MVLPPPPATPSRPSRPRVSGMIASGPASPARPTPPPTSGKYVGVPITPPAANGFMAPEAAASDDDADAEPPTLPVNPDNRLEMPLVRDFSSGLKARRTARSEIRKPNDFKT